MKVDGSPLGGADASAPFSATWNTTALADGPHSVSATARDAARQPGDGPRSRSTSRTPSRAPPRRVVSLPPTASTRAPGRRSATRPARADPGTAANTRGRATGKYGKALSFNGTSSIVSIPNAASLTHERHDALEAWANPSALGTTWRTLLFKQKTGGMNYALYANNNLGRAEMGRPTSAARRSVASRRRDWPSTRGRTSLATYDGSALKLYVNGSLVATTAVSGPINTSNGALTIGGNAGLERVVQGPDRRGARLQPVALAERDANRRGTSGGLRRTRAR